MFWLGSKDIQRLLKCLILAPASELQLVCRLGQQQKWPNLFFKIFPPNVSMLFCFFKESRMPVWIITSSHSKISAVYTSLPWGCYSWFQPKSIKLNRLHTKYWHFPKNIRETNEKSCMHKAYLKENIKLLGSSPLDMLIMVWFIGK